MIKSTRSYRFTRMTAPLKFPVFCNSKCVIPEGAKNVRIAFRQSHLSRLDANGNSVKMNVYLYKGHMYHQ